MLTNLYKFFHDSLFFLILLVLSHFAHNLFRIQLEVPQRNNGSFILIFYPLSLPTVFINLPLQIAVYGKSFNHSARDAWELFQSTGVEALVAYDCSGAVLLMGTVLGGLITGTCAGAWTWTKWSDRVIMVGSTAMLMGMVLVIILLNKSHRYFIWTTGNPFLINSLMVLFHFYEFLLLSCLSQYITYLFSYLPYKS